jgi:hypothetical protein
MAAAVSSADACVQSSDGQASTSTPYGRSASSRNLNRDVVSNLQRPPTSATDARIASSSAAALTGTSTPTVGPATR